MVGSERVFVCVKKYRFFVGIGVSCLLVLLYFVVSGCTTPVTTINIDSEEQLLERKWHFSLVGYHIGCWSSFFPFSFFYGGLSRDLNHNKRSRWSRCLF